MIELETLAERLGIDPKLLLLLQQRETGGLTDPHAAESSAGALGALQVMPETGAAMAEKYGLDFDTPEGRMEAGARYYKEQLDAFGDPATAAAAYHSGPGRVQSILDSGGDLSTDLGPVGRDYYSFFKENTAVPEKKKYVEGAILRNDAGDRIQLIGGQWVPEAEWETAMAEAHPYAKGLEDVELKETPPEQQNLRIPNPFAHADVSADPEQKTGVELPFSAMDLLEWLPAAGGAVGGALGTPAGPAGVLAGETAGSGLGEYGRQEAREALGYKPATGALQELMELDPESPEARAAGIAGESGMGALFGLLPFLRAGVKKPASESLRESARRSFAKAIDPNAARGEREIVVEKLKNLEGPDAPQWRAGSDARRWLEDLLGIEPTMKRGLPFPARKETVERVAGEMAEDSGAKVRVHYGTEDPAEEGLTPAVKRLREGQEKNIQTEAFEGDHTQVQNPTTGEWEMETTEFPPTPLDKRKQKALKSTENEFAKMQERREKKIAADIFEGAEEPPSDFVRREIWEAKKMADERAQKAASNIFRPGQDPRKLSDSATAWAEAADALGEYLAKESPEGAKASKQFNAARILEDAAAGRVNAQIGLRWLFARMIPGKGGTAIGFGAAFPRFWRGLSMKGKQKLARALELGDKPVVRQMMRGALTPVDEEAQLEEITNE